MSQSNDNIANAVAFLKDPSVKDTSISKKIQFLESKGMSDIEIETALNQVNNNNNNSVVQPTVPAIPQMAPPIPYYSNGMPPPPPPPRGLDWKDYVIMCTTTAGVVYGAYQVVSRYVIPKLIPPSQSKLDEDKEAMEREFQRVENILEKLETDQTEFIKRQDEKSKLIDDALIEVDAIVKATNEKNLRNEETLKYLKLEIESIKTSLLKSLESQKSTISTELQELEKKTDSIKETIKQLEINGNGKPASKSNSITPSSTPPPNLLTNNRSTSNTTVPTVSTYSNLKIPDPSSIPSAKSILNTVEDTDSNSNTPEPVSYPLSTNANIPAWQLASSQKNNTSIPAWQVASENINS